MRACGTAAPLVDCGQAGGEEEEIAAGAGATMDFDEAAMRAELTLSMPRAPLAVSVPSAAGAAPVPWPPEWRKPTAEMLRADQFEKQSPSPDKRLMITAQPPFFSPTRFSLGTLTSS